MSKSIVIIGAGGHAKVVADIALNNGYEIKGFLDDDDSKASEFTGFSYIGKISEYKKYTNCEFVIAIGNQKVREKISNELDVKWATLVHPSAVISGLNVEIGEGTVVMAGVVINPYAKIGKHCIINTCSVVEHDNMLEDYVHISPNATLCGTVAVGKLTHIGAGATVKNNVSICESCVIGAGAVVTENIKKPGTYVGVPVRKIK